MSLKETIRDDPIVSKYIKKIKSIKSKDEVWLQELESLHARRGIRALNSNQLLHSAAKISIDSNIDNQAVRSRCVEIKIAALKQLLVLNETIDYLKKYISSKYSKKLQAQGNMTERKNYIEFIISPLIKQEERIKVVTKIADEIIGDADAAGFALMRINESLNMKSKDR